MNDKAKRIIAIVLGVIPSLMLLMSAAMKFAQAEPVVTGLTKAGLGDKIMLIGVIELVSVALFLIPKTWKIGFLLVCGYLGGAMSIEIAGGQFPVAGVLLAVCWVSAYLRDRSMFVIG
jgi:hypothetical protein